MATKQELAKIYADRLIENKFSIEIVESIILEIKNIQYEESGNIITIDDRVDIANKIKEYLGPVLIKKGISIFSTGGKITEERSNDNYLDLIDYVLDNVKK